MRRSKILAIKPKKVCMNCGKEKEKLSSYYCSDCKASLLKKKLREI